MASDQDHSSGKRTNRRRKRKSRATGTAYELSKETLRECVDYLLQLAVEWEGFGEEKSEGAGPVPAPTTDKTLELVVDSVLRHRDQRAAYVRAVRAAFVVDDVFEQAARYRDAARDAAPDLDRVLDDAGRTVESLLNARGWFPGVTSVDGKSLIEEVCRRRAGKNIDSLGRRVQAGVAKIVGVSPKKLDDLRSVLRRSRRKPSGAVKSAPDAERLLNDTPVFVGDKLKYAIQASVIGDSAKMRLTSSVAQVVSAAFKEPK